MRKLWPLQWSQGLVGWGWGSSKGRLGRILARLFFGDQGPSQCVNMEENWMGWEIALAEDKTSTERMKWCVLYSRATSYPQALEESSSMGAFPLAGCSKPSCSGKGAPPPPKQPRRRPSWGLSLPTWNLHMGLNPEFPDSGMSNISSSFCLWHQPTWAPFPVVSTWFGLEILAVITSLSLRFLTYKMGIIQLILESR